MKRGTINFLLLNDDDLQCRRENMPIEELCLLDTSFILSDLEPYDLIVYQGRKGVKVMKSRHFKNGIVK